MVSSRLMGSKFSGSKIAEWGTGLRQFGESEMGKKTAYERELDKRYGKGFSDILKKQDVCPKCKSNKFQVEGSCPECASSIHFCEACHAFFSEEKAK